MNRLGHYGMVLVVALATSSVARGADPVTDAQNKVLARRAAEADCYRKLAEAVYGVRINSDTYVRDFVTESDEIRASMEHFVKGIRLGTARYYPDGLCEVDGEVTVAKLVTELKASHEEHYKGNSVSINDIASITERLKKRVIKATGAGAPRPELPPDLPDGIEEVITPLPDNYVPSPSIPDIWRLASPQGRLMAERAARVDAMRKLLEQVKGLRLTSDTLVRDFITEYDEIATRAEGIVIGAEQVGRAYLHQDELIAEVTMEVPLAKVVTKLQELHETHYHGNHVHTQDITNITKTVKRTTVRATGSGVPPARMLRQAESRGVVNPPWFSERIEATGQGTDPAIDTAQGKLKAARAAELDALRRLAEQIYGLQVSSNTTVQDFVTQHDEISTRVEAVIAGATAGRANYSGGVAEVTVSIPGADVWAIINGEIQIDQRRGT